MFSETSSAEPPDQFFLDAPDENESASSGSLRGALLLVLTVLAAWGCFTLGAIAAHHSSRPATIGPIVGRDEGAAPAVVVHVAGLVQKPGVYQLPANARVRDALQIAGGLLPTGDANALNLAAWVEDGQKIEVPPRAAKATTAPSSGVLRRQLLEEHQCRLQFCRNRRWIMAHRSCQCRRN